MFTLYFLSQRTALMSTFFQVGFPGGSDGKESACNVEDLGLIPIWKISCRREQLPTPAFLPGKFHGQRSLVDNVQESDMTE